MNKFAVIDIGSNSVRLMMIASGKVLYKAIKTTRLGEGLAFSARLCEAAKSRKSLLKSRSTKSGVCASRN